VLPETNVGRFTEALYADGARLDVINMRSDWKRIFAFEHEHRPVTAASVET
jgi:hypothetical protein